METKLSKQAEIAMAGESFLHVYHRYPIILERGEGVYLFDTEGKKYLDFGAGIAVSSLGYGNQEFKGCLKEQIDKLLHTSNFYYNTPSIMAGRRATKAAGLERVFFTNSGTEAVEGAIKAARKYAFVRDGHADHEIIAMQRAFHGRSLGALSITGTKQYREPFEPLLPGIRFADFNDLDSVHAAVTDKTCAIFLEPIQGEGGVYPADPEFLQGVKKLCEEKGILLVFDEIQCGMGRTGEMFAWQHYGVKPDIMTCAKAMGCGIPVGAFFVSEEVASKSLVPGDHGTTYGYNPLAGAAVDKVFEIIERENTCAHVKEIGAYLEQKMDTLVSKYDFIVRRRGVGLMQGLVLTIPAGDIVNKAMDEGLLVLVAGSDVLRFVPPLVIEKEHVDEMVEKLEAAFTS